MDFLRSVQKYHWSTDRNFHLPKKNCMTQFRKSNLLQMLTHVLIIPFICAVFEIWQTHMLILKQNHFFVLYMWISISFSLLLWHFHLNIYYWTFRHITSILTELNNFEANLNIWFSRLYKIWIHKFKLLKLQFSVISKYDWNSFHEEQPTK